MEVGLCASCFKEFSEGDKIICDTVSAHHFSSVRCANLYYRRKFILTNVAGD